LCQVLKDHRNAVDQKQRSGKYLHATHVFTHLSFFGLAVAATSAASRRTAYNRIASIQQVAEIIFFHPVKKFGIQSKLFDCFCYSTVRLRCCRSQKTICPCIYQIPYASALTCISRFS
jgi:hypothetical protein